LSNGVLERAASPIVAVHCDETRLIDGSVFGATDFDAPRKQYGRHGDITPTNILWYRDGDTFEQSVTGLLKITDFGQAEINSANSKTRARDVANTLAYRPPECDAQPSIIGQSYDIWSLGCVYLEFVSWLLGGSTLTTRFSQIRRTSDLFLGDAPSDAFFEVVRDATSNKEEFCIKSAVIQSISDMHAHENCTMFIHDFINLIQDYMLVVNSTDRDSCAGIWRELRRMLERCENDNDYAVDSNPWCNRQPFVARSVRLVTTPDVERKIEETIPDQAGTSSETESKPAIKPVTTLKDLRSRIPIPRSRPF
jgi:serine/threonine protein kinase